MRGASRSTAAPRAVLAPPLLFATLLALRRRMLICKVSLRLSDVYSRRRSTHCSQQSRTHALAGPRRGASQFQFACVKALLPHCHRIRTHANPGRTCAHLSSLVRGTAWRGIVSQAFDGERLVLGMLRRGQGRPPRFHQRKKLVPIFDTLALCIRTVLQCMSWGAHAASQRLRSSHLPRS